jgi:hypothetical protein
MDETYFISNYLYCDDDDECVAFAIIRYPWLISDEARYSSVSGGPSFVDQNERGRYGVHRNQL